MNGQVAERRETLWMLPLAPGVWAAHFVASYATAAVYCAKLADPEGSLSTVRVAITLYTLVALAAVVAIGYVGLRRHRFGAAALPHDDDTPEDRHRFLGFATLLLSGLSAVAVMFSGLVVVFIRSCE